MKFSRVIAILIFCTGAGAWANEIALLPAQFNLNGPEARQTLIVEQKKDYLYTAQITKDDTFTTNKKRAMELCRGIRERKLGFFWSCDTRVDLLTEPLLREMRLDIGYGPLQLGGGETTGHLPPWRPTRHIAAEEVDGERVGENLGVQTPLWSAKTASRLWTLSLPPAKIDGDAHLYGRRMHWP